MSQIKLSNTKLQKHEHQQNGRRKPTHEASQEAVGKIDAEGCKIINDLITEDTERTVWPENMELKFTGKKGAKMTRMTYDMKAKRYT